MCVNNISYTYFQKISSCRQAMPQIIAVAIKNFLLVGFGMTLGYPTILIPGLQNLDNKEIQLNSEQLSWIGSINLICVPIGCLLSGPISQRIGRKRSMQIINIPLALTWLLFKFSSEAWHIYLGLCLLGLLLGFVEAPVITYVAEITTPKLRGILSSTSTMSTITGILLSFILGTFYNWREVAFISFVIPVLSINLLMLVPESPHWLITKNRFLDGRKSLAWLRGWVHLNDIEAEFQELCKNLDNVTHANDTADNININQGKCHSFRVYTNRSFLWPFSLVSFVFFLRHFTGMTNIQTYAIDIFSTFQAPVNRYYATMCLGTTELLGCLVCVSLVGCMGKRLLTFITMFLSSLCLFLVGTYGYLYDINELNIINFNNTTDSNKFVPLENMGSYHWIPTAALIAFAFFSHAGLRILPWILTGEVYNNETRAVGAGLSAAVGYIFGFIINKIFFNLITTFTLPGLFWFYGVLTIIGLIILYFYLPETEGKTLQEISNYFSGEIIEEAYNVKSRDSNYSEDWQISFNALDSYKRFTDFDTPV